MRSGDWRASPNVEDKRPLSRRFEVLPQEGYLGAVGAGPLQQALNNQAESLGSDLPAAPQAATGYYPRGRGPEHPAAVQMDGGDPDYRQGGPERQPDVRAVLDMLRVLYARPTPGRPG